MPADDISPPSILSTIVDTRARDTPNKVFCEILQDDWRERGSREVTYAHFARAVDRACWWLEEEFGPSKNFDSFVYVGDNDLRYIIALVAAQKSQRTMVIAELDRLTHAALLLLLESTNCTRWLGGSDADTKLGETLPTERPGTQLSTFPPLEHFLADGDVPAYMYNCTWEEAKSHTVFVIHSSGTTGIPKPLPYTLELFAVFNCMQRLPDGTLENQGLNLEPMIDARTLWAAPPKWIGGIYGYIGTPLFFNTVPIWLPASKDALVPASVVEEIVERTRPAGAFYVPSMLRDLCERPRALELVRQHTFVAYGGAALDERVGDLLCQALQLVAILGATETSIWPMRRLDDPRDWRYYRLDPCVGGRLEPLGDASRLHELVLHRSPAHRRFQGAFMMYPDRDVYHTNDLFEPHPTNPELVLFRGRRDDLFKLDWLTKVRSSDLEGALAASPRVADAMVGGEGRPTPFVIVQPNRKVGEGDVGLDEMWSVVKGLNETLSAEIHIPRENIIVTDRSRPLKRLGKGTLDRRGIMAAYREEIDGLYPAGEQVHGAVEEGTNGTTRSAVIGSVC